MGIELTHSIVRFSLIFAAFVLTVAGRQAHAAPPIRVATYNLNVAMAENPVTLKAIRDLDADVLLLQEIGDRWKKTLQREFAGRYAHMKFHSKGLRWGGPAILSKHPILVDKKLKPSAGPFPAWITHVKAPAGVVQILNVHLFPPVRWIRRLGVLTAYRKSQDVHLKEMRAFSRHLDHTLPTLIVGDFNEDRAGKAIAWLLGKGYKSVVSKMKPTWRWQTKMGMFRWEMDHILHDSRWTLVRSQVVKAGASDHLPVAADLTLTSP